MPVAVAVVIVVVALARGGYYHWGMLALELGAVGLLLWAVAEILWGTKPKERAILSRTEAGLEAASISCTPSLGRLVCASR